MRTESPHHPIRLHSARSVPPHLAWDPLISGVVCRLLVVCSEMILKIIMVGDSGVGKSCLLKAFMGEPFDKSYTSTIGVDFGQYKGTRRSAERCCGYARAANRSAALIPIPLSPLLAVALRRD
jgi:hypothetical protein